MAYPSGYWAELVRSSSAVALVEDAAGQHVWLRTSDGLPLDIQHRIGANWADLRNDNIEPILLGSIGSFSTPQHRFRKAGEAWIPSAAGISLPDINWPGSRFRFYYNPPASSTSSTADDAARLAVTLDDPGNQIERNGSVVLRANVAGALAASASLTWSLEQGSGRLVPFGANQAIYTLIGISAATFAEAVEIRVAAEADDSGATRNASATASFVNRATIQPPIPVINTPPQTINAGESVQLDARDSDPGGTVVSRRWTVLPAGGAFSNAAVMRPRWDSPDVVEAETQYVLTYEITDDDGQTAAATVVFTVRVGNPVPSGPLTARALLGRPIADVEAVGRPLTARARLARPAGDVEAVPDGPLAARARLGRPIADVEAVPQPLVARALLRDIRVDEGPLPDGPLVARALLGRPVGLVDPEPEPLTARALLGRPVGLVDPEPEPLVARARLGRPIADVQAVAEALTARALLGRPIADVQAVAEALTARARLGRPIADVEAVGRPLTARARLGRPSGEIDPVPRPLVAYVRLGRPRAEIVLPEPEADAATRYARALRAVTPVDIVLTALEVTHPDVDEPVRVVNDTQEQTIEGNRYIPLRFRPKLSDDAEDEVPRAQIAMDNVGEDLTQWVSATNGGQGATVRALQVLAGEGSVIWEVTLDVAAIRVDARAVTVDLGFDPELDGPAVLVRHDPQTSPGLF